MKRAILGIAALVCPLAGLFAVLVGNTVYGCYLLVLGLGAAAIFVRILLGYSRMDGIYLQAILFTILFGAGTVWFGVDLIGRMMGTRLPDGAQIGADMVLLVVFLPFGIGCGISAVRLSRGQDLRNHP
jgi:hypothetical protein